MTEAVKRVLQYAFEEAGMDEIIAYHSVDNPASGAVMRKCGMKYEGFKKAQYRTGEGAIQDCENYRLTKDGYFKNNTGKIG